MSSETKEEFYKRLFEEVEAIRTIEQAQRLAAEREVGRLRGELACWRGFVRGYLGDDRFFEIEKELTWKD